MKITVSDMPGRGKLRAKDVVELARIAEASGIDRVGVTDSPFRPELVSLMAACLTATSHVQVESLLTTPYRRAPDVTAQIWGTLSEISGGRAILGIGRGSDDNALWIEPWGFEHKRALAAIRQLVEVSRQMWAGEVPDAPGPWTLSGRALAFEVEHAIPILIGGRGPAILKLAAEEADIVHLAVPFNGVEYVRRNIDYVREQAAAAGRAAGSYEIDLTIATSVSRDRAHARRAGKRAAAGGIGALVQAERSGDDRGALTVDDLTLDAELVEAVLGPPPDGGRGGDGTGRWARNPLTGRVEDLIDDRVLDAFVVAGTPAEVEEGLLELREALPGATGFRLKPPPFIVGDPFAHAREQTELLGEVARRLR
jgi:5,10-methylenetetrahydromethanopterin reductase